MTNKKYNPFADTYNFNANSNNWVQKLGYNADFYNNPLGYNSSPTPRPYDNTTVSAPDDDNEVISGFTPQTPRITSLNNSFNVNKQQPSMGNMSSFNLKGNNNASDFNANSNNWVQRLGHNADFYNNPLGYNSSPTPRPYDNTADSATDDGMSNIQPIEVKNTTNGGTPSNQQSGAPYLEFDGSYLKWMNNGKTQHEWKAMSGQPEYQSKRYQNVSDLGPIPEGEWSVKQSNLQNFDDLSFVDKAASYIGGFTKQLGFPMGKWPGAQWAWGNNRVWLEPSKSTNTYNRDNFSIHGGSVYGSAGCIDLAPNMPDFTNKFQDYGGDMMLNVRYNRDSWK